MLFDLAGWIIIHVDICGIFLSQTISAKQKKVNELYKFCQNLHLLHLADDNHRQQSVGIIGVGKVTKKRRGTSLSIIGHQLVCSTTDPLANQSGQLLNN